MEALNDPSLDPITWQEKPIARRRCGRQPLRPAAVATRERQSASTSDNALQKTRTRPSLLSDRYEVNTTVRPMGNDAHLSSETGYVSVASEMNSSRDLITGSRRNDTLLPRSAPVGNKSTSSVVPTHSPFTDWKSVRNSANDSIIV